MKPIKKVVLATFLLLIAVVSFTQFTDVSGFPAGSMTEDAALALQNRDKTTGLNSTELINMLELVDETRFMNVTSGNITLTVSIWGPTHFELSNGIRCDDDTVYTYFEWVYIYNGVDFNRVKMTFKNGTLSRLDDDRVTHPIGSIDINISKEQGIETAKQYISGFINKYNFTIANVIAVLDSTWNESGQLHPYWGVKILFNQNVSGVWVYVWADSGLVHWSYRVNGSPFNAEDYEPFTAELPSCQLYPTETPPPISSPNAKILNSDATNEQFNNEIKLFTVYNWTKLISIITIMMIVTVTTRVLFLYIKRKRN